MKPYYSIKLAIQAVADHYRGLRQIPSACDARCGINDVLENAERSGYRVHHGYNQPRAVASVKRLASQWTH